MGGASLEAIEEFYRRGYPQLVRTASAITGGVESGRDAVHDAFVAAVRTRASFRGDGTVDAWVWRIVVTGALKQRSRTNREIPTAADVADRESSDGDVSQVDGVRRAVASLPERQRLVLFLRFYGDLDYRSIASALGIQPGTVGAELSAAKAGIRQELKEVATHE